MTIDIGNIYFIKQSFFDLVNDESLPKNKPSDKDGSHNRPAYCAIKIDQDNYYWVIPFSRQVQKYIINQWKNMVDVILLLLDLYWERKKHS